MNAQTTLLVSVTDGLDEHVACFFRSYLEPTAIALQDVSLSSGTSPSIWQLAVRMNGLASAVLLVVRRIENNPHS